MYQGAHGSASGLFYKVTRYLTVNAGALVFRQSLSKLPTRSRSWSGAAPATKQKPTKRKVGKKKA